MYVSIHLHFLIIHVSIHLLFHLRKFPFICLFYSSTFLFICVFIHLHSLSSVFYASTVPYTHLPTLYFPFAGLSSQFSLILGCAIRFRLKRNDAKMWQKNFRFEAKKIRVFACFASKRNEGK
jgi:hypothetical protein